MQRIPSWYALALREIGTSEVAGPGVNPRVVDYYKLAGAGWVADDSVPWCAAFANAMLALAGVKGTGSLAARSFLEWGRKAAKPYRGSIVVFKRGNKAWQGHVGFVEKVSDHSVWCLGGNQGDRVCVRRFAASSVLGLREPMGAKSHFTAAPRAEIDTDKPIWLVRGSAGAHVEQAQRALNKLGYAAGDVDGIFGARTARAVTAFQRKAGLKIDGVLGPKTWDALTRAADA